MKIFVSYTVHDELIDAFFLKKIQDILNEFGTVYIDLLDNYNGGQERVIRELSKSDLLVLIKTPKIFDSQWVKTELQYAYEKNIPIINLELTI